MDHLAVVVKPADVRRLHDLLDEIAGMYHLDDPNTAVVGPVDSRIIESVTSQIRLFGESKTLQTTPKREGQNATTDATDVRDQSASEKAPVKQKRGGRPPKRPNLLKVNDDVLAKDPSATRVKICNTHKSRYPKEPLATPEQLSQDRYSRK